MLFWRVVVCPTTKRLSQNDDIYIPTIFNKVLTTSKVLFFEDPEPVQSLEKAFPIYAHHFPIWSEHTSAMHQYALWVALEQAGFGASLQHYNPIVDRKVQEHWNIPLEWKLRAQLVFGGKAGEAGPKEFKPVEQRLFVHGAKE